MSSILIISIIILYFGALIGISIITSKNADSDAFFVGNRESPWYLVAFGMIGASLSGVTFISVPGNVGKIGMAYYQIVLGYVLGYAVIGLVLMPLYYRLNLISIYTYLEQRFGYWSYKTGAFFFLLSRTLGSSLRLYLAANVLQIFLFDAWNVPFVITVAITILLIWVYTFKGGIKTIVWTDTFQTFFLVSSVAICVVLICGRLNLDFSGLVKTIMSSQYATIFHFEDINSKLFFPKQFFGGAFLAIAMTGLDQDLMQKNLTCKNIGEAQKNMFWFTIVLVFVNLLFLTLGALLYIYSSTKGIPLPAASDDLFPSLALHEFGTFAGIFFLLGIIASSYASADSAMAALTTSFCIDFLNFKDKQEAQKQKEKFIVHIGVSLAFLIIILIFRQINDRSLIDTVLTVAAYTYGPLLGMYSFGLFTKMNIHDKLAPYICVLSPILTYIINANSKNWFNGYEFGFELLILNGLITFLLLLLISKKPNLESTIS